jgi:hypothetical protein
MSNILRYPIGGGSSTVPVATLTNPMSPTSLGAASMFYWDTHTSGARPVENQQYSSLINASSSGMLLTSTVGAVGSGPILHPAGGSSIIHNDSTPLYSLKGAGNTATAVQTGNGAFTYVFGLTFGASTSTRYIFTAGVNNASVISAGYQLGPDSDNALTFNRRGSGTVNPTNTVTVPSMANTRLACVLTWNGTTSSTLKALVGNGTIVTNTVNHDPTAIGGGVGTFNMATANPFLWLGDFFGTFGTRTGTQIWHVSMANVALTNQQADDTLNVLKTLYHGVA